MPHAQADLPPVRRASPKLWLLVAVVSLLASAPGHADEALWTALRDGRAVALMRHALAPGTGDPADFRVEDCATQRNLSDEGRTQAGAIGDRFRAHQIEAAAVYSSQWCRCLETARLLDLGPVTPLTTLNSFFQDRAREPERTAGLEAFLRAADGATPMVLVTHQVNITAFTGEFARSGEIVVVASPVGARVDVLGSIAPSD